MNKSKTEAPSRKIQKGDQWKVSTLESGLPMVTEYISPIDKLIAMALDKNLDLDRVERLLAMKKEENAEYAKRRFYEAFSKFQHDVPKVVKAINVNYKHKDGGGET